MRISFSLGLVVALAGALFAATAQARPHKSVPHGKHKAHFHRKPVKKVNGVKIHPAKPYRPALAENFAAPLPAAKAPPPPSSTWLVTVNAKLGMMPDYPGAARYGVIGYPTLSFRRPGDPEIWSSPDDRISMRLYESGIFALGPVLNYSGGRYDLTQNLGPLRGVHDVNWTLEGGVFADLWLLPDTLRARGEIRHGFRSEDGFVATLGGDWVQRIAPFTFAIGPRLKFGDGKFMNEVFGLTAADARAMPVFTPYRPSGGLYSAGLYGSATYKQSEQWSYTLHGGYDRLTGQAAASPIVQVSGSNNQWIVGATASYTFEVTR